MRRELTSISVSRLRDDPMTTIISQDTAYAIWMAHREIEVGQKLIADIPPVVTDLNAVAAGNFADVSKAETDGTPVTSDSELMRQDLGLPATG